MKHTERLKDIIHCREIAAGGQNPPDYSRLKAYFDQCVEPVFAVMGALPSKILQLKETLSPFNWKISYVCDSYKAGECAGLPIVKPCALSGVEGDLCVIFALSGRAVQEVLLQLVGLGVKAQCFLSNELHDYLFLLGRKLSDEYLSAHAPEILEVYDFLADEKSKDTFIQLIKAGMFSDYKLFAAVAEPYENIYFDPGVMLFGDDEVLIDAGACRGEEIDRFKDVTAGKYKEILSFEPDRKLFDALAARLNNEGNAKVSLYNCGLCDRAGTAFFDERGDENSKLNENGNVKTEMEIIDNYIGRGPTLIKMDIEGAEMPALFGARETICALRPKMAISAYHRKDDLWTIPLYLKKLVPEYKIYLRHYERYIFNTICYAVTGHDEA